MKIQLSILAILVLGTFLSCSVRDNIVIENKSGLEGKRVIEISQIETNKLLKNALISPFVVEQDGKEIQTQLITNPINNTTSLLLYPDMKGEASLRFIPDKRSNVNFKPLAHAELWHKSGGKFIDKKYIGGGDFMEVDFVRVPDSCTDHSFYIKYEGPGWESNLVGYRFYLDWRNAVDVFGKKTEEMILENVGQDGYDSYHELQDWGMDILKVGSTLGVGTIAYYNGVEAERVAETDSVTCAVLSKGGLRAQIKTNYYGWKTNDFKTNFASYLSIDANSRLTSQVLVFDEAPKNCCTGIYIDKNAEKIELQKGEWTCLATWGKQSLNADNLGLCIFAKTADVSLNTSDSMNYLLVLKPVENKVSWFFGASWELDPTALKTKDAFVKYLEKQLDYLNNPDVVTSK
jgi:hypothetical protein